MSKYETQINQVYLVHPDSKKSSLVLYEETLQSKLQLFVLLELTDIKKKTEASELKKISEVVLKAFRKNQKMPAPVLFETTLAQINQDLADIAHKGTKTWLGKFSAIIGLKSDQEILLANTGAASAWIKRKRDFSEILAAEKKGDHPIKTFLNFAAGKIKDGDNVILTTNNLFNFVSLELLTKLLSNSTLAECCDQVSKILQDSSGNDDAFAAFFLEFQSAKQKQETLEYDQSIPARVESQAKQPEPMPLILEDTYAPLPESLEQERKEVSAARPRLSSYINLNFLKNLKIKFPKFRLPTWHFFNKLTIAGKFFLISFIVFILVFAVNLTVWGINSFSNRQTEEVAAIVEAINSNLAEASSALIYKDDQEAVDKIRLAKENLDKLHDLDEAIYTELLKNYNQTSDRINRITRIENPTVVGELKLNPEFIAKAGNNFLLAGKDSKTIATFSDVFKPIFTLNATDGEITGLNHIPNNGNWVATPKHLYRINETEEQFQKLADYPQGNLLGVKYLAPNRAYTADKQANQIYRLMLLANGNVGVPQSILKTAADLSTLQDFGIDVDVYLLFPSGIRKFVTGNEQSYSLDKLTDPLTGATKLFVGNSIYVLEPGKKRIIIYDKSGNLLNQIFLPNANELRDFYVDENSRQIKVINGNALLEITI